MCEYPSSGTPAPEPAAANKARDRVTQLLATSAAWHERQRIREYLAEAGQETAAYLLAARYSQWRAERYGKD
jgi:hypothetical protein